MPVYRCDRKDRPPRVVEAKTPAGARAHVAANEIAVSKIDTATAFKLASDGVKLETAGEAKPTATQFEVELVEHKEELDPDRLREDQQERQRLAAEDGPGED